MAWMLVLVQCEFFTTVGTFLGQPPSVVVSIAVCVQPEPDEQDAWPAVAYPMLAFHTPLARGPSI